MNQIKKMTLGLLFAIMVVVIIKLLNDFILKMQITEFLTGWFACCGYNAGIWMYDNWDKTTD